MRCSAKTKSGVPCKKPSIVGAKVCNSHGGSAPQVRAKAAVRAEVMKWTLGEATDDPGEVLLRMVTQSRMRVDGYSALIEQKVAEGQKAEGDSFSLEAILVGTKYGEFGNTIGEYIHGLIELEATERDRLVNFAAKAIGAGLAERQVRVAERQGELLAELMRMVMADKELGLTVKQREAMPRVFRRQLSLVQPH